VREGVAVTAILRVTFRDRRPPHREEIAWFGGDEKANALAALEHAYKNDMRIVESADLCPDPDCDGWLDGDGYCSNLCGTWE
jgi:hypothetical protein